MTTERTPLETAEHMLNSLRDRDLDGVLDCFDDAPDVYIFVEGPRWSNQDGRRIHQGWRDYFQAPIQLNGWQWAEGPEVFEDAALALVAGIVEYDFEGAGEPRHLRMRMTWVLRKNDEDVWKIIHEHGSQPLDDPYGTGDWLVPDDSTA